MITENENNELLCDLEIKLLNLKVYLGCFEHLDLVYADNEIDKCLSDLNTLIHGSKLQSTYVSALKAPIEA